MGMMSRTALAAVLAAGGWMAMASAVAQSNGGCTLEQVGGTERHSIRCASGLTAIAEAGAAYTLLDRDGNGETDGIKLDGKALLLEFPDGGAPAGFEVITPQAIAAVRGTRWIVAADAGKTSVFVRRGSVAVTRVSGDQGVTLAPGDGVDVETGAEPLTVRQWPAARVAAMMARFGQ
ncbi:FecR domain-containing protein [Mesorhizobium sp. LHD-90]|uniref:FecR domain-containing protein n=1 Tax=Mesorhizobium sp. LHD-90 TaxID=3071414 RepID=UPI0027E172D6|nr:FecR domain-containing protein [Mesorhizobium sp. LHD-90]MDQ6434505.1 FecR domain-containing protein [Mesorhizobium sp. LHD-90]